MSNLPHRFPAKKISSRRLARIAEQARAAHDSHSSPSSPAAPAPVPLAKASLSGLNWLEVAAVAAMLVLGVLLVGQYLPRSQPAPESTADGKETQKVQVGEDGGEKPQAPKPVEPTPAPTPQVDPAPKETKATLGEEASKNALAKNLKKKVSFNFVDMPLSEGLAWLGKKIDVDISIAPGHLVEGKSAITLKVSEMEAEFALEWLLKQAGLIYKIVDERVVVHKEVASDKEPLVLVIYDVSDLVNTKFNGSTSDLAKHLRLKIAPDTWTASATVEARADKLVVMQRPAVHQKIDSLLAAMRMASLQSANPRKQAPNPPEHSHERQNRLIAALGADDYEAREAAEKALLAEPFTLLPTLKDALGATKDPEVKTRLERVLHALEGKRAAAEFLALRERDGSIWGLRSGENREVILKRYGGSADTEGAVQYALKWLASHQENDGHWDCVKYGGKQADVATTGMALLAFLGAGHSEIRGKYNDNIKRAVAWLRKIQSEDGCLYKPGETHGIGYHHGIAGLALVEAADMGSVPETLKAAQRAVDYSIFKHQNESGGWRYNAKQEGDICVSAWFVAQLKAAKAAGLKVDPAAFQGAIKFLDGVEAKGDPKIPKTGHRYGYKDPQSLGHRRTAMGCYSRQLLGWVREDLEGGVAWFVEKGGVPEWGASGGSVDLYYWYYGTLCAFQQGGAGWKQWNEALKKTLVDNQRKGGDEDGSWDPVGAYADYWGRTGQTALGALCLEVYYRYPLINKE